MEPSSIVWSKFEYVPRDRLWSFTTTYPKRWLAASPINFQQLTNFQLWISQGEEACWVIDEVNVREQTFCLLTFELVELQTSYVQLGSTDDDGDRSHLHFEFS